METDILVQGFKEVETKYGLCYITFTGDGDSTRQPGHAIKCQAGDI